MHRQHITLPILLLFTASVISSAFIISRRDTGASTWNSIKGSFDPSAQELWDPVTGPTYKDIAQGNIGDCWLDASMAAIAYADKNRIKISMVDPENGKGTVPVTLYNGSTPGTYEITKRTITSPNLSGYSDAAPEVTGGRYVWPSAMEDAFKAYAKAIPSSHIRTDLWGGTGMQVFSAVYGTTMHIEYRLISSSSDGDLWGMWNTVATKPTVSATGGGDFMDNGLPTNHLYTAIRCDQSNSIVTLRNPWGMVTETKLGFPSGGGKGVIDRGDGVFDINFADWKTHFVDLTAAQTVGS